MRLETKILGSSFRCSISTKSKKPFQYVTDEKQNTSGFSGLGVSPKLVSRLSELMGITKPLEIQSLALPAIFKRRNIIMQSETGSGKTLAYLLPTIQQARQPCTTVIIVPTRELAYQIYIEARKLIDRKDVACYVSRPGIESEFEKLKQFPPKIVIGTPKQLLSVVQDHEFLFSNVKRVITDEIDKMFPRMLMSNKKLARKQQKHPKPFNTLLAVLQGITKNKIQFIACSATINEQLIDNLKDYGWSSRPTVIRPEKFNDKEKSVPSCIKHNYVLVQDNSVDSKAAVISKIFTRTNQKAALVFVHRDHSVSNYVAEMQNLHLNAVAFYKEVVSGDTGDIIKFLERFRTGKISVVVVSEEEVRGLDFKELDHVYLFDVPRSLDDYLHMAGRVGRLGREGTVTTIVSELHEVRLARLRDMYSELGVTAKEIIV